MINPTTTRLIRHFLRAYPARTAVLVCMLILAGLSEAAGIATLLPLLDALGNQDAAASPVSRTVNAALSWVGLAPTLVVMLGTIVGALVLKACFRMLATIQIGHTVAHVTNELRINLMRALMESSWPYFINQPAGRLSNAVSVEAVASAASYRAACALFASGIQAAVYASIAFLVSWHVALAGVLAGGGVVLLMSRVVAMSRDAGSRQVTAMQGMASRLVDALSGMKAIKAMAREDQLRPLLEQEAEALREAQKKQVVAAELMVSAPEPILAFLLALGVAVGVTMLGVPIGSMFVLGFLFYRLAGRITAMQSEYQAIAWGESSFASLEHLTEEAQASRERTEGLTPPALSGEIRFEDVTFSYGEGAVLQNAQLRVRAGEFVTMVGPSGTGKTTTLDLLVGFLQPNSGSVTIDGADLRTLDLRAWRRAVGYVPQDTFLFHDTLRENVTLGDPHVTDDDVLRALDLAGATDFVAGLARGIHTNLGERGGRLSGGQRQRVGLARALLRQPALLILDEVTSALDADTEEQICRTLDNLPPGVTILAISHRPGFVARADRIVKLQHRTFVDTPRAGSGRLAALEDELAPVET
jgi:ATP-binding cassette, subfamily C, bacterial